MTTTPRQVALKSLALCLLSVLGFDEAVAATTITVTWDTVRTEVTPDPGVGRFHLSRSYVLSGRNDVAYSASDMQSGHMRLGQEGEATYKCAHSKWAYKVAGNTIFMVSDYGSFSYISKVKVYEKTKYACSIEFKKRPGYKYFEWVTDSGTHYFSEMHAENVTCSVAQTPD
jgi:hypothetical protein